MTGEGRLAGYTGTAGPSIARLYHLAVATVFVVAWASLGAQVPMLLGPRGVAPVLASASGDRLLQAGVFIGAALATAVLAGIRPRACLLATTLLYLGYCIALKQLCLPPDELLVECGLLGAWLPVDRPSPLVGLLIRLVLFKLYFETGLAKLVSPAHQWVDGTAMARFYEVQPVPSPLAPMAHALPAVWHRFETWLALGLELGLPFLAFGGRRARLLAAAGFTLMQGAIFATSNFGFLQLAATLPLILLLDESDAERVLGAVPRVPVVTLGEELKGRRWLIGFAFAYVVASCSAALAPYWGGLHSLERVRAPLHVAGRYRMFDRMPTLRVEAEVETLEDGVWSMQPLRYHPGNAAHPLVRVAPHLPRVAMLFWFFATESGGSPPERIPPPVRAVLARVCQDPTVVQGAFAWPLPAHPEAVRLSYARYRYATASERALDPAAWRSSAIATSDAVPCAPALGGR